MVESKVGRTGASFYTLLHEGNRLAYVWERKLHTDMPNPPKRQRLEFYQLENGPLWRAMFNDCESVADRVTRFMEYVADGDITIQRMTRVSPQHKPNVFVYDSAQITIDTPSAELFEIGHGSGMMFPKSLAWSNLTVKEHYRLATTYKKEPVK